MLNDQPIDCDWQSIYNTSGSVVGYGCTANISAGSTHTVHHAGSGVGVAVLVYGFNFPQSYGYNIIAGLNYPIVRPGMRFQNDVSIEVMIIKDYATLKVLYILPRNCTDCVFFAILS